MTLPTPILGSYKRRHSPRGTRVVHITNGVHNVATYATRILGNIRIAIDEHRNERLRNRSEHKRHIKGDKSRAVSEIRRDCVPAYIYRHKATDFATAGRYRWRQINLIAPAGSIITVVAG